MSSSTMYSPSSIVFMRRLSCLHLADRADQCLPEAIMPYGPACRDVERLIPLLSRLRKRFHDLSETLRPYPAMFHHWTYELVTFSTYRLRYLCSATESLVPCPYGQEVAIWAPVDEREAVGVMLSAFGQLEGAGQLVLLLCERCCVHEHEVRGVPQPSHHVTAG